MPPDLQRLCEAAKAAEGAGGSGSRYEAIVRAVLTALREPSVGMVDAGATGSGEDSDHVAKGAWKAMIDHILAEPAHQGA